MKSLRTQTIRHPKAVISPLSSNYLHLRNPWVAVWWSAALPGFGQILSGRMVSGGLLFIWELIVNSQTNLNLSILYTFLGDFDQAAAVVNTRWVLIYVPVWVFTMYYSYRTVVEGNKRSILADRWDAPLLPSSMGTYSFNFLERRQPWIAVMWSAIMPGLGQIYNQKVPEGFFCLSLTILIVYLSHFCEAVVLCVTGHFGESTAVLDPAWLLFLPSIYGFCLYLAYSSTVEGNKLFDTEQSRFLIANYQDASFEWPV